MEDLHAFRYCMQWMKLDNSTEGQLLCGADMPFLARMRASGNTIRDASWKLRLVWTKLAELVSSGYDGALESDEGGRKQVFAGYPAVTMMQKGWRLGYSSVLPSALRGLHEMHQDASNTGEQQNMYICGDSAPAQLRTKCWTCRLMCRRSPRREAKRQVPDLKVVLSLSAETRDICGAEVLGVRLGIVIAP